MSDIAVENIIFRERPNERNECDQWTLVKDPYDQKEYVVQEHVLLDDVLSGKPYLRLIRRMTVAEFLSTDQPAAVKRKLQSILDERKAAKSLNLASSKDHGIEEKPATGR